MRAILPFTLLILSNIVFAKNKDDSNPNAFADRMLQAPVTRNIDFNLSNRAGTSTEGSTFLRQRLLTSFNPTSYLTSYIDKDSCGARGDDAKEDLTQCLYGANKIAEESRWCYTWGCGCVAEIGNCCYRAYKIYECKPNPNEKQVPFARVDFSEDDCLTCAPYTLENGAQIKTSPGGFPALRIDSDGPYAKIPGIDIGPSNMPDCTLTIGLYLESIPSNALGWIFGHEEWNVDRTIILHDSRSLFKGKNVITSGVGDGWMPWASNNLETGTPPTKEWFHVTAVFRQGGECAVYVNGVKSDYTTTGNNDEGFPDLYVGRPGNFSDIHANHWADAWIKEVKVFDEALSDFQIEAESAQFFGSIDKPPVEDYEIWLDGESWKKNAWLDKSTNGHHSGFNHGDGIFDNIGNNNINTGENINSGMAYLYGSTKTGFTLTGWPSGSEYTFFHITKYNGSDKERIWKGTPDYWLSGHDEGNVGVFYHGGWNTQNSGSVGDDWVMYTDRVNGNGSNVRVNSEDVTITSSPNYNPDTIGINIYHSNTGVKAEKSDWAAGLVLVYDRYLSDIEVQAVEEWIIDKYSPYLVAKVDFSQGDDCPTCSPYVLEGGAEIKTAPGGFQALRIDSDGPRAKIPNVDISPSKMPECTMTIGVYLESIPDGANGWILGHEYSGWDRTIVLHDPRDAGWVEGQNMISSVTGSKVWKPWADDNLGTGTAPTKEWFHVTAVFRQGGDCVVYVNGVKSDHTTIGNNDDGLPDLYVGREGRNDRDDSWSDAWIKEVKVYSKALSDIEVQEESEKFLAVIPSSFPSSAPSNSPSVAHSLLPSSSPSDSPSVAHSILPSFSPSDSPSEAHSILPSSSPSEAPSEAHSILPSSSPSEAPSEAHSILPSTSPSEAPSEAHSILPSSSPSEAPSEAHSILPSSSPSEAPSEAHSILPSSSPSEAPSEAHSILPSSSPSEVPSEAHSILPSSSPSEAPSEAHSILPSSSPSDSPSEAHSILPSSSPSEAPSEAHSILPSSSPSEAPSEAHSILPSSSPSEAPSEAHSVLPSSSPSEAPPSSSSSSNPSSTPSVTTQPSANQSMKPSNTPSDFPSEAHSILPSSSPSNSPSLSQSPSGPPVSPPSTTATSNPSTAPSFPTWRIDDGNMNLDNLTGGAPYVLVTHGVGTANAELQVKLYKYDCTTPVTDDAGVSISNDGISDQEASYHVDIAKDSLGSSAFLEASGDTLKFCVEAALYVPNDTNGWGSIVSKKSIFDIEFDLELATFDVGFTTQGENPEDNAEDIDVDDQFYDLTTCVCSESFTCDSPVPTLQENSDVFICLIPSTGVSFKDFSMTFTKVEQDGSLSFTYDAVAYDASIGQTLPPFTSIQESGTTTRVRTQLLSGLFDVSAEGSAKISGSGTFSFNVSGGNGKQDDVVEEFGMDIPLARGEESGNMFDCLFGKISLLMKHEVGSKIFKHPFQESVGE